jgi:Transglycosylase-like domain
VPPIRSSRRARVADSSLPVHARVDRAQRFTRRLFALCALLAVPLGVFGTASTASAALPTGAGMVLNAPIVAAAATPDAGGYWEVASDGGIFAFGDAGFYGSTGSLHLNKPIVGMASTPDGRGYWLVASDGGIFAFGDAGVYGSTGSLVLTQPMVGMASTPDGSGYWMVAADGGIFAFGDAQFQGSASGMSPSSAIVGMAPTVNGRGYWLAAANGSVYAFGVARFRGTAPPGHPVVGISARGGGYRLATADGGVFAFGARFDGSLGGQPLDKPVIGLSSGPDGYLLVAADGGIFAFGAFEYDGSLGGSTVEGPPPLFLVPAIDLVTPYQAAAWGRVNMCEESGNWNVDGPLFSGGLGFTHANWNQFNTFGFPSDAAFATPEQQIRVAVAFATYYWGNPNAAPDQHGCGGGY